MKTVYKKSLIVSSCIMSCLAILSVVILGNESSLFFIAAGLDKPSRPYYFITENIYKLGTEKKFEVKLLQQLKTGKNRHLHNLYIHTLGILGYKPSEQYLLEAYSAYQDDPSDPSHRDTFYDIILSIGLIESAEGVPIFEALLESHEDRKVLASKYGIARSLYLCTGRQYKYVNERGNETRITMTDELLQARRAIVASRGRKRAHKEIIILDRLDRPPGW